VLKKEGRKAEAIKAFGRALAHGDFWQFRYERGNLYFHADQNKEALEDLNKAVEQNPQDADALYERSWVSYELGFDAKGAARSAYFAQAYDDIVLSVALDPTDEYHQKQLAFVRENIPAFAPPPRS
jgi:tetratricopeptide (TPR) repeat protein